MLLAEIADFLLQTVSVILGVTLLARAYMTYLGLPARNPLAQFATALTDWLVRAAGRLDVATLLAALFVAIVFVCLRFLLVGLGVADWPWPAMVLIALIELLRWALYLVLWVTLLHVVLSWVNPHAPIAPAVLMLARPFLAPFQRALPLVGGIDLSPVVVILIVNVMLIVLARSGL